MRKFFALIVISFSLAVLEVDNKRLPREPVPIVFQMDKSNNYMRAEAMKRHFEAELIMK